MNYLIQHHTRIPTSALVIALLLQSLPIAAISVIGEELYSKGELLLIAICSGLSILFYLILIPMWIVQVKVTNISVRIFMILSIILQFVVAT